MSEWKAFERTLSEISEELKRGHITLLLLAIFAYPSYIIVDWFVSPERWLLLAGLRIAIGLYALVGFLWFRRIPARNHIYLVYLTVWVVSFCQMIITLIAGEITYLLASALVPMAVGSLIPVNLRNAIGINLIMFVFIFLMPYMFLGFIPGNETMGVYGLITGIVACVLSSFISVSIFNLRESQLASYKMLQQKNEETLALAEDNKRQKEAADTALAELVSVVSSLKEATERIQQASSHLSSFAEEMRTSISEVMRSNEDIYRSIGEVDTMLQNNKDAILKFSEWEKGEATNSRKKLVNITREMSNTVAEIGNITNIVTNISRKTHILALNAVIEATRTGASDSFGVIATRMRDFSEEVRKNAREIVGLTRKLQNISENLLIIVDYYTKRSDDFGEEFLKTSEGIDVIAEEMSRVRQRAETLSLASQEQIQTINVLVDSAVGLKSLVEDLNLLMDRVRETDERIRRGT